MSWRDRAAAIVGNTLGDEPQKPKKALISVFSVPTPVCFQKKATCLTDVESAELRRLVGVVADANGWSQADRAEALAVAIEHQQLDLFRTLASELRTHQDEAHRQVASKAQAHSSGPYVKPDGYECATFSVPTSHGWCQFVVEIPAAKYDPFALWDLYRKHHAIH